MTRAACHLGKSRGHGCERLKLSISTCGSYTRASPPADSIHSPSTTSAMSVRPTFTSKAAWDALDIQSGEESEEEVYDENPASQPERYAATTSNVCATRAEWSWPHCAQRVGICNEAVQERYQKAEGVGSRRETSAGKGRTRRCEGAEGGGSRSRRCTARHPAPSGTRD